MAEICVYYDVQTNDILDILPHDITLEQRAALVNCWQQPIIKRIFIALAEHTETTTSKLATELGHSPSTIHDNIAKLEKLGFVSTKISYERKKQRVITPEVLFVTKSPKFKGRLLKFFQGLWVNSNDMNDIISFLQEHKGNHTVEQISASTKIPIDRVEVALSNWDSIITRGISQAMKDKPFVKEVTYRAKK